MLDKLRQFIAEVTAPLTQDRPAFSDTDYRLAATALLIHVVSLDGEPSDVEKQKLHSLLQSRFQLDAPTASQLIAEATLVEGEAVDLYHFTSIIMRSVDEEGRKRIIEMMWELVYADGNGQRIRGQCDVARGGICSAYRRATASSSSIASPTTRHRTFLRR